MLLDFFVLLCALLFPIFFFFLFFFDVQKVFHIYFCFIFIANIHVTLTFLFSFRISSVWVSHKNAYGFLLILYVFSHSYSSYGCTFGSNNLRSCMFSLFASDAQSLQVIENIQNVLRHCHFIRLRVNNKKIFVHNFPFDSFKGK